MPRSVNARITKFPGAMGPTSREDAAGAVLNYDDKIVVVDFFSWDPLPWLETWDISAYGTEGLMQSCPSPSSYRIYDKGNRGFPEGWTEWSETSFPINWASRRPCTRRNSLKSATPVFFDRELATFSQFHPHGGTDRDPATQALNISTLIEALFASSKNAGAEVTL